jgi:hypothetical protein
MGLLRALGDALRAGSEPSSAAGTAPSHDSADACVDAALALPRFLDVTKYIPLNHAEISALYFVVEDFEEQIRHADPADPTAEAQRLATLLQGVIQRWNEAEPNVYADLIELPWDA